MQQSLEKIIHTQRKYFQSNVTKSVSFRKQQLQKLLATLAKYEKEIYDALQKDLNKSEYEAFLTEYSIVCQELKYAIKYLKHFAKPHRVRTPMSHFPGKSFTIKEPYGVTLVLSPWNYPFQLSLAPLVAAMAAGNCVILKSSKNSIETTRIISKIITETFPAHYICVLDCLTEYDEILKQKYDYIFFTGSERIGKVVMRAASEHVTPVSLELGGKSPCIIEKSADLKLAAKRILWGKLLNAGQTCVAPDYVVIPSDLKKEFIQYLQYYQQEMFSNAIADTNYPKIISPFHFQRLIGLIGRESSKTEARWDELAQKIAPVFFTEANFDSEIMKEEIFGPILPIIAYDDMEEIILKIKERSKPLACYIFSKNKTCIQKLLREISFGGGCINDVVMHLANHQLPFGGVGGSGMGEYHGSYSMNTFSHEKAVFKAGTFVDIPFRYAPYNQKLLPLIRKILG